METVKKISMELEFAGGEKVVVPIRPASYATVSEVMKIELEALKQIDLLDKEYAGVFEQTEAKEGEEPQFKVVDPVAWQKKQFEVTKVIIQRDIEVASAIANIKNLTTAQKEEFASAEFWATQDYIDVIKPAVESFRSGAKVKLQ